MEVNVSKWDQHNLTGLFRDILRSVPPEPTYGVGRSFLTTYQLAVEFNNRHPQVIAALGQSIGGQGQGPYAFTTYVAKELARRAGTADAPDIELRFLAPLHLSNLECDNNGEPMTATTPQAGWNTTMFRYIGGPGLGD
jgi:hypothetical protein